MVRILGSIIEIVEKIEVLDKWLLIKLAIDATTPKDRYLRNSIAKSISLLKSINYEYSRQSYNEGWILFRALIDRLVYIYYLKDNNKFEEFEEWSFIQFFEHQNKARSDERFRRVLNDKNFLKWFLGNKSNSFYFHLQMRERIQELLKGKESADKEKTLIYFQY